MISLLNSVHIFIFLLISCTVDLANQKNNTDMLGWRSQGRMSQSLGTQQLLTAAFLGRIDGCDRGSETSGNM